MTFGEKIKSERKKRGMTQSQLAGNTVTRNMISLIEKDLANPSLDTLRALAMKLEVPLSYLVSDAEDTFFYLKQEAFDGIKEAYAAKSYAVTVSRIEKLKKTDDELSFILADCHLELGKKALTNGSLVSCTKYLNSALEYADATCYDTEKIKALSKMYLAVAENIQSPLLEFDIPLYEASISDSYDLNFFNYLTLNFDYSYTKEVYSKHLTAKRLIKDKNYAAAIEIMTNIEMTRRSGEYNSFVIFGIYSDLELCYKQLYDFENAYKYASKRLSLLEAFKS